MAEIISINDHSSRGELGISKKVIASIVDEATKRVLGEGNKAVKDIKIAKETEISFTKSGKVNINVSILLKKGLNPEQVCLKLHQEIARDLAVYTESVPFEIIISIDDIK